MEINTPNPAGAPCRPYDPVNDEISRPGVSAEFLRRNHVCHVNEHEALAAVGYKQSGLLIPYPDAMGAELKVKGRAFCRLRLDQPMSSAKYLSPRGAGVQLYLPAGGPAFGKVLVVTEGEFKSLALCEAGIRTVGIGGISCALPGGALLPALSKLLKRYNPHTVFFLGDADTCFIYSFSVEALKLARALPAECSLRLPRIPLGAGGNGIDDMRESLGDGFTAFWEQISAAAYIVDRKLDPRTLARTLLEHEMPAIAARDEKELLIQKVVELGSHLDRVNLGLLAKTGREALGVSVADFREQAKQTAKARKAKDVRAAREATKQTAGVAAQNPGLPQVTFPPRAARPTFICYDEAFFAEGHVSKAGVYYHYIEKTKDEFGNSVEELIDLWICSPIRVLCVVRSGGGNEHSYLVEYLEHGQSSPRRTVFSQAMLLGRLDEFKALRDIGVSVLHENLKFVRAYLDREHLKFSTKTPDDFWRSAKVIGWAPAPDAPCSRGRCFVLPNEILSGEGNQAGVWFSGKTDGTLYTKGGTLEEWRTNVAALCENNPFLVFGVSAGFAGPMLELCNVPGIGFHLFGDSTSGKTTALAAAGSVWGPTSFVLSWRTTINGLESQAAARSSTLIALDESHIIEAKALDASIYLLANGTAKARMTKDISAREIARWRVCVLSSGERSIESHLGAAKIDHKVGQGIRIADVPVRGNFGLFNDLHGRKDGSVFSDEIRSAAGECYGHAGPRFVQRLIAAGSAAAPGSALAETLSHFGADLSAQETRVARGFALAALAGELAIKEGIVPWPADSALNAAVEIFGLWRAAQPRSPRGKEFAQILNGVREFIEVHGADFSDSEWVPECDPNSSRIVNAEPVVRERAGYWKDTANKRLYMFNADGIKRASSGFGVRKTIEVLAVAGALTDRDAGRLTKKCWIPQLKRSLNFYLIDPEKLELAP